jgi:hypothetical protein
MQDVVATTRGLKIGAVLSQQCHEDPANAKGMIIREKSKIEEA